MMTRCPHCETTVLRMSSGLCPNCRKEISDRSPAAEAGEQKPEDPASTRPAAAAEYEELALRAEFDRRYGSLQVQYGWLNVPVISWLILSFPLILPPMPVGPLMVSRAWNRRESMSFLRRGMDRLGRDFTAYDWLGACFLNIFDFVTLGLTNLFVTANLIDALVEKVGSERDKEEGKALNRLLTWLALGNVFFLAVWILLPGAIFRHYLVRLERLLYVHEPGLRGTAKGKGVVGGTLTYRSLMTDEQLKRASADHSVLLFAEQIAAGHRKLFLEIFEEGMEKLAGHHVPRNVDIRWCDASLKAPSRYTDIASRLKKEGMPPRGWTLIEKNQIVASRGLPVRTEGDISDEPDRIANRAKEALGLPFTVLIPLGCIGPNDREITALRDLVDADPTTEFVLVTYRAGERDKDKAILEIRSSLLPLIREVVECAGGRICLANTHKKHGDPIREELTCDGKAFRGVALVRNGKVERQRAFGTFSSWEDYAVEIASWWNGEPRGLDEQPPVETRYHVIETEAEIGRVAEDRVAIVALGRFPGVGDENCTSVHGLLREIWPDVKAADARLLVANTESKPVRVACTSGRLPTHGVALVAGGEVVIAREIRPGAADCLAYGRMGREMLQAHGASAPSDVPRGEEVGASSRDVVPGAS